jgi:hypothetical protein
MNNINFQIANQEGQIGEQLYIDYLNDNNITYIDVRDDKWCQWLDIDFIIPKQNFSKEDILSSITNSNYQQRLKRQQEKGYTVEVKLDKATHSRFVNKHGVVCPGTGNIVYEIMSHNMPGCLSRSCADFILYICVDIFEETTAFKKAYMINLYNWRKFLIGNDFLQNNIKLKRLKYIYEKGKQVEENVIALLCPVSKMINTPGIVTDYTEKIKKYFPKNLFIKK